MVSLPNERKSVGSSVFFITSWRHRRKKLFYFGESTWFQAKQEGDIRSGRNIC